MNDIHPTLPPQLDASLRQFYAAAQPDNEFTISLETELRRRQSDLLQLQKNAHFEKPDRKTAYRLRSRPLVAVLIAILSLLILTGLVYALSRLSGFIPGFGFTSSEGTVYILAEPVASNAGTLKILVNQAVSDGEHFWTELSVYGISDPPRYNGAYIILPNEERISFISGGNSDMPDGGLKMSLLFPALAGNPDSVRLLLKDLQGQDINLVLKLRPAEDNEMLPVPTEGSTPIKSEHQQGVYLILDNVAMDADKTVFQVSLGFDHPHIWVVTDWNVSLTDENGLPYPLKDITPDTMNSGAERVYQTLPFRGEENLLLTLIPFPPTADLPLLVDLSADAPVFTFDPGEKPQPGQTWQLDQKLSANGLDLKVIGASLTTETELLFEVEPGEDVTGVMFTSPDDRIKGSRGGVPVQSGNISASIQFSSFPTEPFEVRLMKIYYQAQGTWQIHWNPPAAPAASSDTEKPITTPSLSPVPTTTLASTEPLLEQVQLLLRKFDISLRQGPAWVHIVNETQSVPRDGQTFPPPYLKTEIWNQIDAEGYIVASVYTDIDENGSILQQSATRGNYSVNFTTGDTLENISRHLLSLDTFSYYVANAYQNGNRIQKEEVNCDDAGTCLLITLEDHNPLLTNSDDTQTFTGIGRRAWIHLDSGRIVKEQIYWLTEDGSEKVTTTSVYLLAEVVESPPQPILDILERVVISP